MAWACRNRGQSGAARFFQYPAFGARHRYLRCALLEAARAAAILPLHQEGPGAGCSESFAVNPSRQIGSFRPRLLTHPGVGPVTALATEVFLGDPSRFATANQVASYIGMIPCEHSRGKRQRLGKITKQGNSLLRYLWMEATMHAVQKDPELKRFYRRKLIQKGMGKARVAAARKLGIRLWIMMRDQIDYEEFCRRGKLRQKGEARAGMA
ncbi:MAG: hypothetical protein DMG73_11175 [Acidobacteria bacterium]|nr:MAG: hypothetical protein DMG73_11175 [Acidobacteriota bacterium]PYX65154.1 MAG: hypothetical protein DMG74_10140 [Acidobacteriota bacterium]